jgi:hypothetical protein
MLSIQVNGDSKWVQVEPASLISLILQGDVTELTLAHDPTQSEIVKPIIDFLKPRHMEELTRHVLELLPQMYGIGPAAVDPGALGKRVADLCNWNWADPLIKGRLEWTSAWLCELQGSYAKAVVLYGAYLREPVQELSLRLLAYNNRGVLRVRMGQSQGIRDIAQAAMFASTSGEMSAQTASLPAACFNLLNLINVGLAQSTLRDQLEEALIDYVTDLPDDVREHWLGSDPDVWDSGTSPDDHFLSDGASVSDSQLGYAQETYPEDDADVASTSNATETTTETLHTQLRILKDPSYVRLNRFLICLTEQAQNLAPSVDNGCFRGSVADQLRLWAVRSVEDAAGTTFLMDCVQEQDAQPLDLAHCAEAASLLYACDIPSNLTPGDSSIAWSIQYARKALTVADEYLADADYELAQSTLSSVSHRLGECESNPLIEPVQEQVEQCLADVRRQARANHQLDLYRECTDLVHRAKVFCDHTDLCRAQRESKPLLRQIDQAKQKHTDLGGSGQEHSSHSDAMPLLHDLPKKIQNHLQRLERADLEQRIKAPLERLHQLWPDTWDEPVHEDAYAALKQCRIMDGQGWVDDWRSVHRQLDSHQARYRCREVIRAISMGQADRIDVEEILEGALECDPELAPVAAPIYSFFALQNLNDIPEGVGKTRADIIEMARQLLQKEPLGSDAVYSPAVRSELVREACLLLEKLVTAYHGADSGIDQLWQALETSFTPAFAGGPPEVIQEIQTLLETCLDACPRHNAGTGARSDPRNRLRVLLANCHKAVRIAEGEKYLNAKQPDYAEAKSCFRAALETLAKEGLESPEDVCLLQRTVCGYYLAEFAIEDSEKTQRYVLDQLEQWLAQMVQNDLSTLPSPQEISQKVTELQRELEPDSVPEAGEQAEIDSHSGLDDTPWPIDMEDEFESSEEEGIDRNY